MLKVLFLCTENACRSQMAEGLVNHDLAGQVKAFSAGIRPSRVNPRAIQVMGELGIDISRHWSKSVDELAGEKFDLVITICEQAQEQCPLFPGETEVMHVGFPDPAKAAGTEEEILTVFRWVRDGLRERLGHLLREKLKEHRKEGVMLPNSPQPELSHTCTHPACCGHEASDVVAAADNPAGALPERPETRIGGLWGSLKHSALWFLAFFGIYASSSVCVFCGTPGCPVGAGGAALVGGVFACLWQYGKSAWEKIRGFIAKSFR